MREFGIESLSSSQVSRAAKLLDDELAAWRDRPLGEIKYLILDARYEKMRHGGIVREKMTSRTCSRPSASARTNADGFWACRWPCRRPEVVAEIQTRC